MFLKAFPFGPFQTNAYLLMCEETKHAAIIDPSHGCLKAVKAEVERQGAIVEKFLITHSHWDHFGDLAALKRLYKAPIYVHPLDAENLWHPGSDGLPLIVPVEGVEPDHLFNDGDRLQVGRLQLNIIHTPGHCPGAVCLYIKESATLLSGDTLFRGTIGNLSLPTSCADHMWKSLEILGALPDETVVFPGHGGKTTIGAERGVSL